MRPGPKPGNVPLSHTLERLSIPEPNSGCLLFFGCRQSDGYGYIRRRPALFLAHRVAWRVAFGPIPKDLQVLHRCDVRCCVNPAHLFLGTNDDNRADCVSKERQAKGETIAKHKRAYWKRWRLLNTRNKIK